MAAVSESIVREYFELNEFLVRQYRKHVAPASREEDDVDFLVINPRPQVPAKPLPFILQTSDLAGVERAVVVVRAWHSEVFNPSVLANAPEITRFLERPSFRRVLRSFRAEVPPLTILVVPALPANAIARDESAAFLRAKGIDAALSYPTMLADLVARVEPTRNYQKSDLLQLLRILKAHDFLREPQMELFKAKRTRGRQLPAAESSA